MKKLIGLAMALAKRTGNDYGLHHVFNGESEIWRWEENNEADLSMLVFYRYGYDDYKYDEELLKEDGWRIKDDHGAGYWMIKE